NNPGSCGAQAEARIVDGNEAETSGQARDDMPIQERPRRIAVKQQQGRAAPLVNVVHTVVADLDEVALERVERFVEPLRATSVACASLDANRIHCQTLPWRSCSRLPSGSWNIAAKPQGISRTIGGSNFTPSTFSVSKSFRPSSVSLGYVAGMRPFTGLALVGVPGHRTSSKSWPFTPTVSQRVSPDSGASHRFSRPMTFV